MRTLPTLSLALTSALLLATAGAALADAPGGHPGKDDRDARHHALADARKAALDSFRENRTAALAAYHAALNATRQSFLENKTAVIDACKAARNETAADNSTPRNDQCVRDGLKPLIETAHAQIHAAQESLRSALHAARDAAKAAFKHAKEAWP